MARPVHFELAADDAERAAKFYEDVFGWKSEKWDGPNDYWLVYTGEGPGINGGFTKRQEDFPSVVNTMDVDDIDASVEKVTRAGGEIIHPKMEIPGVGWLAYGKDTEGNVFGMMQSTARG